MCVQVYARKIAVQRLWQPTNDKFDSQKLKKEKKMEASVEAESSVKFSPAEREAVLEVLEECADSLVVYHYTLRQQLEMRSDTANFYPDTEYVEWI